MAPKRTVIRPSTWIFGSHRALMAGGHVEVEEVEACGGEEKRYRVLVDGELRGHVARREVESYVKYRGSRLRYITGHPQKWFAHPLESGWAVSYLEYDTRVQAIAQLLP